MLSGSHLKRRARRSVRLASLVQSPRALRWRVPMFVLPDHHSSPLPRCAEAAGRGIWLRRV